MNHAIGEQRECYVESAAFGGANRARSNLLCCAGPGGLNQRISRVERGKGRDTSAQCVQSRSGRREGTESSAQLRFCGSDLLALRSPRGFALGCRGGVRAVLFALLDP